MTPEPQPEPPPAVDEPHAECSHCGRPYSSSEPWTRAVKRKADDGDEVATEGSGGEVVPVRTRSLPPPGGEDWSGGTMEEELFMLREEVAEQQRTIQELCEELDEERNASTIATNEAMTMILRLQREKAEAVLEARQFKRFAEERMEQDQQDIAELEQEVRALTDELEEYRQRIERLAVDDLKDSEPGDGVGVEEVRDMEGSGGLETGEVDKYESRVEPQEEEPVTPAAVGGLDQEEEEEEEEEEAITANSPHLSPSSFNSPQLSPSSSFGTASSFVAVDVPHAGTSDGGRDDEDLQDGSSSLMVVDHTLDVRPDSGRDDDESSDRVYTIDAVHQRVPLPDPPAPVPLQSASSGIVISQDDFRLLQMRLMALEEDRESLKQALSSIRPSPAPAAQPVSLWEMFQNLTKARFQIALPQGMGFLKFQHLFWALSLLPLLKWIVPLLFYRRKKDNRIRAT